VNRLRSWVETVATVCMAGAAITVAWGYIGDSEGRSSQSISVDPREWTEFVSTGSRIGPLDTPVEIVEFVDFQCPFCRQAQPVLDSILTRYAGEVTLIIQHLPLSAIHPNALDAAMAAECAGAQGRLASMVRVLFREQRSLGSRPWEEFATEAGVTDEREFSRCMQFLDRKLSRPRGFWG